MDDVTSGEQIKEAVRQANGAAAPCCTPEPAEASGCCCTCGPTPSEAAAETPEPAEASGCCCTCEPTPSEAAVETPEPAAIL